MKSRAVELLLGALMGILCGAPAGYGGDDEQFLEYSGAATARRSGNFLYGERHVLRYRAGQLMGRVVLYTCANGQPFARKRVDYVDRLAPDFAFEDASNGMKEGVRSAGGERSMSFRAKSSDAEATAPLPRVNNLVVDAGFDEFIRANWDALAANRPLALHFLVPSRREALIFQVQHLRYDRIEDIAGETFRMKLTGVLGLVFPAIDVTYSTPDHTLQRYEGLSDLRDASGNNLQAIIKFAARDRKPSTPEAAAAADRAELHPCS